MNYIILFLTLVVALTGCGRARIMTVPSGGPSHPVSEGAAVTESIGIPPAGKFAIGEELEYQVSWWGVSVGTAILMVAEALPEETAGGPPTVAGQLSSMVDEWINASGGSSKLLLKLTCKARSNPYLEAIYPVRVELSSFVDSETKAPVRFKAFVRRRWRRHESWIAFDWDRMAAFHQLPKGRTATVPIESTTQDGLSLLYYARSLDFQVGREIPLEVTADGKNWRLSGKILRTGTVKLKGLGSWPAVEGTVELAYPVPFFQGAKASVWFSSDGQRIPLLAKIKSRIGPVTVVLTKRSLPSS